MKLHRAISDQTARWIRSRGEANSFTIRRISL